MISVPTTAMSTASEVKPVYEGVLAVGDHRVRADAAADADLHHRDELVADEADYSCQGDPLEVFQRQRIEQALDGLIKDIGGAEADGDDDEDAGDILKAAVAVGVALVGGAAGDIEGEEQRDGVERVAQIVHGIRQQRHAAARHIDDDLQGGGQAERDQRDPDRADGEPVIEEGLVAGEVGVAVIVGEAGQMQRHGDFDEDIVTVVVMVVLVRMAVGMCHKSQSVTKLFA